MNRQNSVICGSLLARLNNDLSAILAGTRGKCALFYKISPAVNAFHHVIA